MPHPHLRNQESLVQFLPCGGGFIPRASNKLAKKLAEKSRGAQFLSNKCSCNLLDLGISAPQFLMQLFLLQCLHCTGELQHCLVSTRKPWEHKHLTEHAWFLGGAFDFADVLFHTCMCHTGSLPGFLDPLPHVKIA